MNKKPENSLADYQPWPALPFDQFASTAHLLHMGTQMMGKLKLATPYEPEWGNVGLSVHSRGITTGLIPYVKNGKCAAFAVTIDLISHKVRCTTSWGQKAKFPFTKMSVAELFKILFDTLGSLDIQVAINPKPQEIPDPINFDEDKTVRDYDPELANAWWRILVSSHLVMSRHHGRFQGKTPAIAFMWGTFDLRDARFKDSKVEIPKSGPNAGYLRRNALDAEQVECGFWHGNPLYPQPAFYSFIFPQPTGLEKMAVEPPEAYWHPTLGEFILDYDVVRKSPNPEQTLLLFLNSTYEAGSTLAKWDPELIGPGKPL